VPCLRDLASIGERRKDNERQDGVPPRSRSRAESVWPDTVLNVASILTSRSGSALSLARIRAYGGFIRVTEKPRPKEPSSNSAGGARELRSSAFG